MTEQRTNEWFAARLGKVTASRIADVTAKTKTGWGAGRKNYMAELVAERLTGTRNEGFTNAAMQWGTDTEPDAVAAYEFYQCATVEPVGFVDHPAISMTGASPDGLVGDDGLIEIKCPNTSTHLDTILTGNIDGKYIKQMQWQMACTGRKWCDFASYDPRLPEHLRLWTNRVSRDDAMITDLETMVRDFLSELETLIDKLPPDPAQKAKVVNA